MSLKPLLLCATACGLVLPISPALAQEPASRNYDEIIVTARKRQESILKVPVVQSVLTQESLQQNQITDLTDIAAVTTGLLLGEGSLESGTQVTLRGVGTTATDPGLDQSVSLNLDGIQVTHGGAYTVGFFDMAQVEILKGPQALFFGKSSPGGVISIRTADPGNEVEVIGKIGYEVEADEWRGEAILSGPVSDTLGLRLAALYSDFGGFFKNTAVAIPATGAVQPDKDFGEKKTLFLRGTAVFEPTDNFSARLKVNYTRDRQKGGQAYQLLWCPEGFGASADYSGDMLYSPNEDCKLNNTVAIVDLNPDPSFFAGGLTGGGRPYSNITQKFGSLELNYDFTPELSLTSVTGYYHLAIDALFNGTVTGGAAPLLAAEKHLRREEFTQELRLDSDFAGQINFTLGAFYQDGQVTNDINVPGNAFYSLGFCFSCGTHDIDIETISLFGQARYNPVETIEIAAGARWTDEKRSNTAYRSGALIDQPELRSKNWSPELTITYTPTDDFTVFGALKQGYKSGSYNISVAARAGQDISFGDEKVRGGEIGIKSRLMDRQLNLNLAGYYYKYTGLQVGAYVTQGTNLPTLETQNAGGAKVYGVDFDFNYRPLSVPELTVNGAVNWNIAKFTNYPSAPCFGGQTISLGCDQVLNTSTGRYTAQDLKGAPLPRAPEWQATIGANYEVPVADDGTITFGVNGQYSSKYLGALALKSREEFYQAKYFKLNANVSFAGSNDKWEVALIGNNLTNIIRGGYCSNTDYFGGQVRGGTPAGGATQGPGGFNEFQCVTDRGRSLWLRLTIRP